MFSDFFVVDIIRLQGYSRKSYHDFMFVIILSSNFYIKLTTLVAYAKFNILFFFTFII